MEEKNYSHNSSDEITLKELILKIQEFWSELWKFKWWIIICGILLGLFMGIKAYKTKPNYTAHLTFMVNDDDGNSSVGGIGAILGSFGLSGGGGGGKHNLDKILSLSKTRKISQIALFEKLEIEGNKTFLANHIINYKDTIGEWCQKPFYAFWLKESELRDYKFSHDSITLFRTLDNQALMVLHSLIVGSKNYPGITSSSYDEETGIMKLSSTSENPALSVSITKNIFNSIHQYYVKKSIEKQQYTYDLVKEKTDSIQVQLRTDEYSLANLKDTQRAVFQNKDNLFEMRLKGKIKMGYAALGKALENLQIADFSLKNKTPFIQVIDEPLLPIAANKPSLFKALVIGGFLGAFLAIIFFISRKIYKDTLSE